MGGKCCKKYFCCCCGCCKAIFCCCCSSNQIGSGIPEETLQWLLNHTSYNEQEIRQLYLGFTLDFPLGGISRREFEKCFTTKNAQKMSDVVFKTLDADGSGYLDLKEFFQAIELVGARGPEEKLMWAFKRYDIDNSECLDQKEMVNVVKAIYAMLQVSGAAPKDDPSIKAEKIFKEIDVDHDGKLTKQEFLKGCMSDDELMLLLEKLFNYLTEGMD